MRGERKKEGIKGGDERDITETGNGKRRGRRGRMKEWDQRRREERLKGRQEMEKRREKSEERITV